MPRLTKIYTRTGDDGQTGLGSGQRVAKTSPRVTAYGSVDELSAAIGVVIATGPADDVRADLTRIQNELFHVGAMLCMPDPDAEGPRVGPPHIAALEALIDRLNADLPPLANFILPGGCPAAAQMHVARTVCRRAERDVVRLSEVEPVDPHVVPYLNRLSDALFTMARHQNRVAGVDEPQWDSRA